MIPVKTPRYTLGVDMGTASVKLVLLDEKESVVHGAYALHRGDAVGTYRRLFDALSAKFPVDSVVRCGACGAYAHLLGTENARRVDDIEALGEGALHLHPDAACVMDIGGQSATFISGLAKGMPPLHFATNGNCAAGTGAFFEDQMSRLGLALESYSDAAGAAASVPRIAGRCSVFAKTDIIHLQQEGVPAADILLGLAYAVVRNYKAAIVKKIPVAPPVVLAGGTAFNSALARAVKDVFMLSDGELIVDSRPACFAAAGAALAAMHRGAPAGTPRTDGARPQREKSSARRLPPLPRNPPDTENLHRCVRIEGRADCSLGIDIGSTSTNLVLLDPAGNVVDSQYLRTRGDPERAVRQGLAAIRERFGARVAIRSVGATGSGRYLIGKMVGADAIRDEITAQATAALAFDPGVETIFEIGGQDSKYIHCRDGKVDDFQMNRICAAGTGSFLEEQALRLGIAPAEIGARALCSSSPVDLGERCTVFIETAIASCLADNVDKNDIAAGLCLSVVRNYATKVIGEKPTGGRILLQGGVAFNPGIVAAFRQTYGDRVGVTPFFSVTGAVGAALLAREVVGAGETSFTGFDMAGPARAESGRAAVRRNAEAYAKSDSLLTRGYDGKTEPGRKTVGIPRVLLVHRLFPLFHRFFTRLGYNVILSEPTGETTIRDSQDAARDETCYPVKLIHGHMLELARRNVDFIFLPRMLTMRHATSSVRRNYGCVYMQSAPRIVAAALDLEKRGITLLDPVLELDFGKREMARALIGVGRGLGHGKIACLGAVMAGARAMRRFTAEVEKVGAGVLDGLGKDETAFVLITRNYGLADPALNMGIAKTLLELGHKVLTLSHLPAHDMDLSAEYPNLYWPFGQHILAGAKLVRNHPNLYAVYLTNHGCGPDSMLGHLFRREMGDKPFLSIEVDEHDSRVGVVTRIEAFVNSLKGARIATAEAGPMRECPASAAHPRVDISASLDAEEAPPELALPHLYPYSQLLCASFRAQGLDASVLPATSPDSLALGRGRTRSKEYLSFTALLGNVLSHARTHPRAAFFIPQTEGAEADGHYARVVRSLLDDAGHTECRMLSPMLERAWEDTANASRLFSLLLAGDIALAAPGERRDDLVRRMCETAEREGVLSASRLEAWAAELSRYLPRAPKVLAVGEPAVMFDGYLNNGVLNRMEQGGVHVLYAPLAEYCHFLWSESAKPERLAAFERSMRPVAEALGGRSAFSSPALLKQIAARHLPAFAGANGRYRCAKALAHDADVAGCVSLASMYENTATILGMLEPPSPLPRLALLFDGNAGDHDEIRLSSFLRRIGASGISRFQTGSAIPPAPDGNIRESCGKSASIAEALD